MGRIELLFFESLKILYQLLLLCFLCILVLALNVFFALVCNLVFLLQIFDYVCIVVVEGNVVENAASKLATETALSSPPKIRFYKHSSYGIVLHAVHDQLDPFILVVGRATDFVDELILDKKIGGNMNKSTSNSIFIVV